MWNIETENLRIGGFHKLVWRAHVGNSASPTLAAMIIYSAFKEELGNRRIFFR